MDGMLLLPAEPLRGVQDSVGALLIFQYMFSYIFIQNRAYKVLVINCLST
jgi:hypothetical protein